MKKRILSLFLALAMVATAAVVPGTSAEAAYEKGDYLENVGNMQSFMNVKTGDRTGAWISGAGLKVGDVISYEEPSKGEAGKFRVVGKSGDRFAPASTGNISIIWVKREVKNGTPGDWEVAGEGLSYTIEKDDMDCQFAVIAYTSVDSGDEVAIVTGGASTVSNPSSIKEEDGDWTEEEIVNKFSAITKFGTNNLPDSADNYLAISGSATKIKAAISPVSAPVSKGEIKKELFEVASAKVGGKSFGQVGNDLYVHRSDLSGKFTNDIKIIFDVVDEGTKDVLARADKAGGSNDPLRWNAVLFGDDGKIIESADVPTGGGLTADNSLDRINSNSAVGASYRLYVGHNTGDGDDGKYYALSGSAVKTDYNVNVISDNTSAILYMGAMKEGETVDGTGTNELNGTGQTLRYIMAGTGWYADGSVMPGKYVTLPEAGSLRKLDDKGKVISYLQGWSASSNTGALVRDIDNIKLSSDKVYYAVWGDTEPEMVHRGEPVYRVYNTANGEHLYTSDVNEYKGLVAQGWNDEGIKIYGTGGQPSEDFRSFAVRRMYNANTGEHIYVQDAGNEMNTLARLGWTVEAVIYVSPAYGDPVYRLWNGQAGVGCHLWTMDTNEVNVLRTQYGWAYEGTPFNSVIQ